MNYIGEWLTVLVYEKLQINGSDGLFDLSH